MRWNRPSDDDWWDAVIDAAVIAGLSPAQVFSPRRDRVLVQARWRAWRALEQRGFSVHGIAYIAGYDHTTVRHGLERLKKLEGQHALVG
jgi:hypothetical protein